MPAGTRRADIKNRPMPRRLSRMEWMLGRVVHFGKYVAVFLLVLWLCLWLWAGNVAGRAGQFVHGVMAQSAGALGLVLDNVDITGRVNADMDAVRQAINLKRGDPILQERVEDIRNRLKTIPWIADASVRRELPGHLTVAITERTPAAIWLDAPDKPALISADGTVLTRAGIGRFGPLLGVSGAGAADEAGPLIDILSAHPAIAVRIKTAAWISGRRWNLTTQEGIVVKMPEQNLDAALQRLERAQEQDKVLDKDVTVIDLRQDNRIILETKPGKVTDLLSKGGDNI